MMMDQSTSRTGLSRFRHWWTLCVRSAPYARPHMSVLIYGICFALCVVAVRIALPWPLKWVLKPWLASGTTTAAIHVPANEGTGGDVWASWCDQLGVSPVLAAAMLFLAMIITLGFVDHRERLSIARFAIGFVHHLRSGAVHAAMRLDRGGLVNEGVESGDLIARLIGDTARIKTGMKGFLVHVATNGIMFIGVSCVLLMMDLQLGALFAASGVAILIITYCGASLIYNRAARYRVKEGQLANTIHLADSGEADTAYFRETSESSAVHEAAITKAQGTTTWIAHAVFGIAVVSCLWVGVRGVSAGRIEPEHVVLFIFYAVMMRGPMVQLARQGARTGKIFACLDRVLEIAEGDEDDQETEVQPLSPLSQGLVLHGVTVRGVGRYAKWRRLRNVSLIIPAGQRVALLGDHGSGKTTLLQLITGPLAPTEGALLWDDVDLSTVSTARRQRQVSIVGQTPSWSPLRISELLRTNELSPDDERLAAILKVTRAASLLKRLPKGLDTKIASTHLSPGQRKILATARELVQPASVRLGDDIPGGMPRREARRLVKAMLNVADEEAATLVMAFTRPICLSRFDRVVGLRKGRIVFDGSPAEWRQAVRGSKTPVNQVVQPAQLPNKSTRSSTDTGQRPRTAGVR
ncbi:MAG: ABC transporter ATP-binding protein [Planctomycetes bacterium]|nr:ABC transporter ATP-binding protein [Planctomycetota bacterium]NOG53051.1 ABC transporter ATP-binding protein [Planctomycetota bacterium]